ncbi:MAG: glycosyltransferase family 39 protein [Candidatus Saccharimonadales bacterium]
MKKINNVATKIIIEKWWIVVLIGMLVTFVLALWMGQNQNIWFDEAYSVLVAKQPISQLLSLTGVDAHPPFYYLLLKLWGETFGWSELALRSLSAVFASLGVGAMVLLIRRLFSTKTAITVLPFITIGPFWLRYGYEIRMYTLAGFISILATYVLVKALASKGRKWWIVYALLVALGMYTLYMTAVVWLAHLAWLLMQRRNKVMRQPWLWAFVGAVVLFIPYIPTLIYQLTHSALPGIGHKLNITQLGDIASQSLVYTVEWQMDSWRAIGILFVVGASIYLVDRIKHRITAREQSSLLLIGCMVFVPIIFFVILSLLPVNPIFITRYIAHFVLFIYALIGVISVLGWHYGYRRIAVILYGATFGLLVWGGLQLYQQGNFNFERVEHIQTSAIRKTIDCSNSTIVADDEYTFINDWYYFDNCDLRFYATSAPAYTGGYAWLARHDNIRLTSSRGINTKTIVHLYWNDLDASFHPDSRYKLVSSVATGHQVTDTYQLSAE